MAKALIRLRKKYGKDVFVMNSESFTVSLPFNELVLEDNVPQDVLQQSENDEKTKELLKQYREKMFLPQRDLMAKLGISYTTVNR